MIHATNHEAGCYLMAQNMQNRSKELYTNIQQGGMLQLNLFDVDASVVKSGATDYVSIEAIRQKVTDLLRQYPEGIGLTKFIATFVNENNIIPEFKSMYNILLELQTENRITITRKPATTKCEQVSTFWEEKGEYTVTLRSVSK